MVVNDMSDAADIWAAISAEIQEQLTNEPLLESSFQHSVLQFQDLAPALAHRIAHHIDDQTLRDMYIDVAQQAYADDESIIDKAIADIHAVQERDPACTCLSQAYHYSKGFIALQSQRIAHWLWQRGQIHTALIIEHSINVSLSLDLHPAARIGKGILIDHATGIVIGETAVVGDDVSLLHGVTLGGTGKEIGDRHPKIGNGVLIGANACVLGNIKIGDGVKIGAGSVVLAEVPDHVTVAGVPAKIVGTPSCDAPGLMMNQCLDDAF
ncbi:MAG: serine O-acetyltransferase [Planctomycetes bacterium]|nr:serine O-acetyltransferase [Planctomycetota bacterium]